MASTWHKTMEGVYEIDIIAITEAALKWVSEEGSNRYVSIDIGGWRVPEHRRAWARDLNESGGIFVSCPEDFDNFYDAVLEEKKSKLDFLQKEIERLENI